MNSVEVRGTDLRYLLTAYLFDHGEATVAELIEALDYHGFSVVAPSAVSEALGHETAQGRVRKLRHGRYGPVAMPRTTRYRMNRRVLALHARVAEMAA